eukprot:INCI15511.2.p1 GENE.INCI15511.2~~INCI15511.2.p1  ORF type:complete len:720 (+),score=138.36 INCI15511.2:139-2298(+)
MLRAVVVLVCALPLCKGQVQDKPWQNRSLPVEQRVALLLPTLTVEQKIAQTFATHTGQDVVRQFKDTGVGAAKYLSAFPGDNVTAAIEQRNQMQREFLENSNVPVAFINEGLHGGAPGGTIFPMPVSQGCSWNVSLVQSIATVIAAEARAIGVDTVFAPVVNMMVDPRFGRLQEGFSENPLVTSHMGRASVLGLQNGAKQDEYLGNVSVASLGKHYTAYGAAMGGLNGGPAEITKRMLFDVFLRPWKAMAEAGLRSCMPSHNTALNVPCHGSEYLIDTVLRKQFGFSNGVALSDCNDIGVLVDFRVAANVSHAAAIALKAGVDWDLQCGTDPSQWSYNQLNESLAAGLISGDDLDATVSRVLAHKFASGLFDNGPTDPNAALALLDNGAHRQLAREAAEQSAVLLINKGNTALPLARDLHGLSVALLGPTASSECNCSDATDSVVGSYTLSGAHVVTLDEALRKTSAQVQWAPGMASGGGATGTGTNSDKLAAAVALAKTADVSILVLGDIQGGCGEWGDRDDLDLQGGQLQLLEAVTAVAKKTIVILVHGRPQTFGPDNALLNNVDALFATFRPGEEFGNAMVRLLTGEVVPSGKLVQSWPRSVGQVGSGSSPWLQAVRGKWVSNHRGEVDADGRYYDNYVSSASQHPTPLFYFGFGMSYTNFSYESLSIEAGEDDVLWIATVKVKNVGAVDATEVVQVRLAEIRVGGCILMFIRVIE